MCGPACSASPDFRSAFVRLLPLPTDQAAYTLQASPSSSQGGLCVDPAHRCLVAQLHLGHWSQESNSHEKQGDPGLAPGRGERLGETVPAGGAGEGLSPSRVTRETLGRDACCQPDTPKSPQEGRGGEGSEHGVLQWLHGEGWGVQRRESPHVLLV